MSDDSHEETSGGEAVQAAKAVAAAKRRKGLVTAGVAVGIGSAALVAALLYTDRSKRKPD